ncbi:MAG: phosphatase PAP2 family protein, partial [Candidatus Electrothrix sp. AUS1_2]|nr:phosphatase PAP2 family protein [Candidatus Electrothrix sp. AUS1_2]
HQDFHADVLQCAEAVPQFLEHVVRTDLREVVEFGGEYEFTQCWQPGTGGSNSSFPSGHAALAFFLMAPWFVLRDRNRRFAEAFLIAGLLFGTLVGIARILQGGHFVSDILWAGGLLYILGSLLGLALGVGRRQAD